MKKQSTLILAGLFSFSLSYFANAQNIGINTTGTTPNAAAILDLNTGNAGTTGFLPEQVALTATNAAAPLTLPPTGIIVYNTATAGVSPTNVTPGYYYNAGTGAAPNWVQFVVGNSNSNNVGGWLLNGNTGTNPATNFVGTIDAKTLNIRTNNSIWMSILSTGQVGVWVPAPPYVFTAAANAAAQPVGYIANGTNTGGALWAANIAGAGASTGYAIAGDNQQTGGSAIEGEMGNAVVNFFAKSAVSGNTDVSVAGGIGVIGACNNATGGGVVGQSLGANGFGVAGSNNSATGFGVDGYNTNASGTGVIGAGNNLPGLYLGAGSGGSFTGSGSGLLGFAKTPGSGTGVFGVGNNTTINNLVAGSGGAFSGTSFGLVGFATANVSPSSGGYFFNTASGSQVGVDYWNGTDYKIISSNALAAVSASVKDTKGDYVVMHCPETPEFYLEDYGQGKLTNGKAHIDVDPILAKNICVNEKHPLRVYVQLEGDCKGVYVTNKSATGFDVVELNGGNSNVSFQYHIISNAADAVMPSGKISKFADLRFEPSPQPEPYSTMPVNQGTPLETHEAQTQNPVAAPQNLKTIK